jgi:hypothetical protein
MHRGHYAIAFSLTAIAIVLACTGKTADVGSSSSSGGSSSSGSSSSGGLVSGCPSSAPQAGTPCTKAGLQCEYGNDLNLGCNTLVACQSGTWQSTSPISRGTCPTPANGPSCPASYGAVPQQATCTAQNASCAYPEGTCACIIYCGSQYPVGHECDAGTPYTWQCTGAGQGCPAVRPRVGSACTQEGQNCPYGDCNGPNLRCTGGAWTYTPTGCPVSSKKFKRDIHYLGDDELRALAAQTLETRLTTYAYTSGDPSTHLGFIIEDQPESPAVLRGQDRVDLYGYTSMAVATLKVQEDEIQALRREVEALKKSCKR